MFILLHHRGLEVSYFKMKRVGQRGETRAYPTNRPNQDKPGFDRVFPDIPSNESLKACPRRPLARLSSVSWFSVVKQKADHRVLLALLLCACI